VARGVAENSKEQWQRAQAKQPFALLLIRRYYIKPMKSVGGRGGAGRGQGRKPLSGEEPTLVVTVKMTASQRAKLARLGGPAWIRKKIDQAGEPKD
jgi:hypothetical protein